MNIFSGFQAPNRALTLDMETTFGTGDFSQGVEAYYIGKNISKLPHGWQSYSFPIDSVSRTIPPGWVVLRGDGSPGTDADWRALMRDVETLGLELGKPGFAYPDLGIWDLDMDNVRLSRARTALTNRFPPEQWRNELRREFSCADELIVPENCNVICITGGISTGKSTFSKFLQEQTGAAFFDADRAARELVDADPTVRDLCARIWRGNFFPLTRI